MALPVVLEGPLLALPGRPRSWSWREAVRMARRSGWSKINRVLPGGLREGRVDPPKKLFHGLRGREPLGAVEFASFPSWKAQQMVGPKYGIEIFDSPKWLGTSRPLSATG